MYRGVHTTAPAFPMNIQRVVQDLRRALQPSAILCLDNGMYKIHVARAYPALEPNTVLLDNALATMGAGLPAAIAAKVRAIPRPTPHSQFRPHIPTSDPTFPRLTPHSPPR